MAICENCIHYELCSSISLKKIGISLISQDECCGYKDRSRFVELPCDIISKAEIKRELSAQCAVKKIDVETAKDNGFLYAW